MKICCCCITWHEPMVGRVIESFLRQTHPDRELIVLDDAGWYPDQPHGNGWRVVSIDRRFGSLGAKRNAAAALASPDCEAFAVADADDIYLPHWLAAVDCALQNAAWCQPRQALEWNTDGTWRRQQTWNGSPTNCAYHGGWGYRREAFEAVKGYPLSGEEDLRFSLDMMVAFGASADTICREFPTPFYAYSRGPSHISERYIELSKQTREFHRLAYLEKGLEQIEPVQLAVGWDREYDQIEIPHTVHPRTW